MRSIQIAFYEEQFKGEPLSRVKVGWSNEQVPNLDMPLQTNWQALVIEHVAAMLANR